MENQNPEVEAKVFAKLLYDSAWLNIVKPLKSSQPKNVQVLMIFNIANDRVRDSIMM